MLTLDYKEVNKKTIQELERVIALRKQGLYGTGDKAEGRSVVPTVSIIHIWENLTGKEWDYDASGNSG